MRLCVRGGGSGGLSFALLVLLRFTDYAGLDWPVLGSLS